MPDYYRDKHVFFYNYDSYDSTASIDISGNWTLGPTTLKQYELVYSLDWTGAEGTDDSQNQLKYTRTMPEDRTVITFCNYHVAIAKGDRCPVVFASGTAKTVTYKHMVESGWAI